MRSIKNKFLLGFVPLLVVICWSVNACKKDDPEGSIATALSKTWRLASLRVDRYTGDSVRREELNTTCAFRQYFAFDADGTCTYQNYSCIEDDASGRWSLSDDRLILRSDIVCKDTSTAGTSQPFANARIVNLGENSLVLEVDRIIDTIRRSPLTVRRTMTRYGFIRSTPGR